MALLPTLSGRDVVQAFAKEGWQRIESFLIPGCSKRACWNGNLEEVSRPRIMNG